MAAARDQQDLGLDAPPPVDSNGVDLSLIRENLRLTPAQRFEQHFRARRAAEQLRKAGQELRKMRDQQPGLFSG